MIKVLSIFGTRPEAIKMAPVVLELQKHPNKIKSQVCVTGQHREMLDQVLEIFGIEPEIDLDLMMPKQTLPNLTARIITETSATLAKESPDIVLVQGDTTTVMAVALAAFYNKIAVGHVEAGLRSGYRYSPFPEEINRRLASVLSAYHFAPTETARMALLREGVAENKVFVTGNTVIDALKLTVAKPRPARLEEILTRIKHSYQINNSYRLILITAHRRENFGDGIESICKALKEIALRNTDVVLVYPVHLNPNVREPVFRILGGIDRVLLIEPVDYDVMAHLMKEAFMILTDSGGLQEEAPALGKPVLVLRNETERPEAIIAGTVKLIGSDQRRILEETERLLYDSTAYQEMAKAVSPYGDGFASKRIVEIILANFEELSS